MIRLSVISGPDAGKRAAFATGPVSIGRGDGNAFGLRDGLVSQRHGEALLIDGAWHYRDLRSRHGTLVRLNDLTVNLHDRTEAQIIELPREAHVIVGESLVQVETRASQTAPKIDTVPGMGEAPPGPTSDRVVTRHSDSVDAVTRRLSLRDPRLLSIFALSRQLNTVTDLDAILELIAETTFDAFPAANFFAVTRPADDGMQPLLTRRREDGTPDVDDGAILSQSLLKRVYDTRESMLFVRDGMTHNLTDSIVNARITACLAAPLVGQHQLLGVVQADTRGLGGLFGPDDLDLFTVLASYAAFAIERVNLNRSILEMFEGIVHMSVAAIDARDPATAGHSERVASITLALARCVHDQTTGPFAAVQFDADDLEAMRYAALLHDFGKIGVRESVLMKASRLAPDVLERVRERFAAARLSARDAGWRDAVAQAASGAIDLDSIEAVARERSDAAIQRLDENLALVEAWQPGRPMPADVRARMDEIGRATWLDASGSTRTLLTADEIDHMQIPRGTLSDGEWADMRAHVTYSYEFLARIPWSDQLARVPEWAWKHHEKLDGSGYPRGLVADEIPLPVRILQVADVFDAMTAVDRSYRHASPVDATVRVLREEAAAGQLDSALVELFIDRVLPSIPVPGSVT